MNTVTLRIDNIPGGVEVEMPAATTGRYAAKRAAEACGYDSDGFEWELWIVSAGGGTRVPMDEPVVGLEGKSLWAAMA